MNLRLLPSLSNCCFPRLLLSNIHASLTISGSGGWPVARPFLRKATSEMSSHPNIVVRRSANYQPSIWHYDYIQSLTIRSEYVGESCTRRIDMLKEDVRMMLHKVADPSEHLELVDILQRLGLSYHFENELRRILEGIYNTYRRGEGCNKKNLYATALEFRLLRQHGYSLPQEIFSSFKNEKEQFKTWFQDDIKGLLCLYEASFILIEGESILEEARDFAAKQLKGYIEQNKDHQNLYSMVSHALELPLHWRMPRLEARWFIDEYRSKKNTNPVLLELAGLDFNRVQAAHQEDLKQMSSWWRSTGLGEKLSFSRNRLMENFLWTVGEISEPQFGYCRRALTKVNSLVTTIDDVYDVYGTLDELELFTDAVERWDTNVDGLPYYLQICFLSLHNFVNEMAFDVLKEQGQYIIRFLKKAWADLCRSYLQEAKWYNSGYTPSFEEYIENSWISIAGPIELVHAYFCVTNPVTQEGLDCLEEYPNIIRWSSMVFRLADDLATSKEELERGDVPKSIQCYINETGASEEDAREHIRSLIAAAWKKLNEERAASSPFSEKFVEIAMNLARMAQCMYQHGDGHGVQDRETKDRVSSLLIHPISSHI